MHVCKTPRQFKMKEGTWSDDVGEMMENRNIQLVNDNADVTKITKKSIMDWAKKYVAEEEDLNKIINYLNYVRIYKKMHLPCEMVRIRENKETAAKRHALKRS